MEEQLISMVKEIYSDIQITKGIEYEGCWMHNIYYLKLENKQRYIRIGNTTSSTPNLKVWLYSTEKEWDCELIIWKKDNLDIALQVIKNWLEN